MKKTLLSLVFLSILLIQYGIASAQTGPAGVGNKDGINGQPKNLIWLDAASITVADGDNVTQWDDKSGNNISFVESNSSHVAPPTFIANGLNNLPAVRFRNTYGSRGSTIVKRDFTNFPTNNITTFIVYRTVNGEAGDAVLSYAIGEGDYGNEYLFLRSNSMRSFIKGRSIPTSRVFNDGNTHILAHRWSSDIGLRLGIDGQEEYTNGSSTIRNKSFAQGGCLAIGNEQDEVDGRYESHQALDGDIAEIIIYDAFLNDAQKTIIENYLQTKYAMTTDNDHYDNASYTYDFAGIGQEANGNQTSASSSNSGFYIEALNDLNDGEYIMFAHNNSANSVTTTDCPASVQERWSKDWYMQFTGSLGTKITFDLPEGISGFKPQEIQNYVLLYRSTTSGDYTIIPANVNFGDVDQVEFQVTSANIQTGYYTLGSINSTDSPVMGVNTTGNTWYTLASGDWTDHTIWTLDPSGILYNNPTSYYPQSPNDKIVIGSGKNGMPIILGNQ